MNKKLLMSSIFGFLLTLNLSAAVETIYLESITDCVPWEYGTEPDPLPKNWQKHKAKQNIVVEYAGAKVTIPEGDHYFTYEGKVAIGWHGTYNPPCGM